MKVAHGLERLLAHFLLELCSLMLATINHARMASIFIDRLQLTPFTSTKKLTEGLGDTGFSNFSISGKRHPTISLSRINVAKFTCPIPIRYEWSTFVPAAEDTQTSSPRFTDDFVVSQLDEFFGEVSGLVQIKNFILLAVLPKPYEFSSMHYHFWLGSLWNSKKVQTSDRQQSVCRQGGAIHDLGRLR